MIRETETQFGPEFECGFEANVILLSHFELDFWQAVRTKIHMISCSTCKKRKIATNAVRNQFLTVLPSSTKSLLGPIRLPRRSIRTQIVLAAGFAFVGIVLAFTYMDIFGNPEATIKTGTNKTKADVGATIFPDCDEPVKAGAPKKPTKQKVMLKIRTE